jgi:hypothetical protein
MFLLLSVAAAADRVEGSETLALGSTAVAHPRSNSVLAANPSMVGLVARYDFGFAGSYGQRGLHWNVTAVDSKTSDFLGFGVSYSGDRFNPPLSVAELPGWSVPGQELTNRKRNHDLGLGLAVPLFDRRLSIGVNGSVSFFDHERQGRGNTGNIGAGLGVRANDHAFIGLSARNVLPVEASRPDRPFELLGGLHLTDPAIGSLSLEGGARPDRAAGVLVLAAGGEAIVAEGVALRSGWRLEDGGHDVTFGLGTGSDTASFDIGAALPTTSLLKPVDWTVQLSLRIAGPDIDAFQVPR